MTRHALPRTDARTSRARRLGALAASIAIALPLVAAMPGAALADGDAVTAVVDAGVDLSPLATETVLVHAADGALADVVAVARDLGLETGSEFPVADVVAVRGNGTLLSALAATPLVERLEADLPLQHFTNSSHRATRGQDVIDGAVGGTGYDGTGVGVVVNDSGVDGTHPGLADNMGRNEKIVPFTGTTIAAADTDTISAGGHGTHVAGIVGSYANGSVEYHGAAPGATVHGISSGTLISVHSAAAGLQWTLDLAAEDPSVRVVNNSWGSGAADYDPDSLISQLNRALVDAGVVVVYAAGNDGGDGSRQTTSPTCIDPTPGVICVASGDDFGTGDRTQVAVSGFSSRGEKGEVGTYPDILAPGSDITSTCRAWLPICVTGTNDGLDYWTISGTSMAAPHVAGIAAQVLQANPSLTPAEVEDVLEDTAWKFGGAYEADPSNPGSTTSFDKGHGLVDVVAAVSEALNR